MRRSGSSRSGCVKKEWSLEPNVTRDIIYFRFNILVYTHFDVVGCSQDEEKSDVVSARTSIPFVATRIYLIIAAPVFWNSSWTRDASIPSKIEQVIGIVHMSRLPTNERQDAIGSMGWSHPVFSERIEVNEKRVADGLWIVCWTTNSFHLCFFLFLLYFDHQSNFAKNFIYSAQYMLQSVRCSSRFHFTHSLTRK